MKPFEPIRQSRASEQIVGQIQEAIVRGTLKPGDRLPGERELSEMLKVSRSSLREALRELQTLGVLSTRRGAGPDAGSTIASSAESGLLRSLMLHTVLREIRLRDFVEVRAILESYFVRVVAEDPKPADIEKLRDLTQRMADADSPEDCLQFDFEFHVDLARSSGNELATALMGALRRLMGPALLAGLRGLEDWRVERDLLVREHNEIVDCIEALDAEGAEAVATRHVLRFHSDAMVAQDGHANERVVRFPGDTSPDAEGDASETPINWLAL
jgi:DNA-binding FadR family transcriptional regulator